MEKVNKLRLNDWNELNAERQQLRNRAVVLEYDIKSQYKEIATDLSPIFSTIQKFTKIKNTITDKFQQVENNSAFNNGLSLAKLAMPLVPAIAGRMILKRRKKLLFQTLIGYGLAQATKYVFSKNGSEHVDSIKKIFKKDIPEEEKGIF